MFINQVATVSSKCVKITSEMLKNQGINALLGPAPQNKKQRGVGGKEKTTKQKERRNNTTRQGALRHAHRHTQTKETRL